MAKRKNNRAARWLLGVTAWNCLRISNRRMMVCDVAGNPTGKQHVKPSRRQRRAELKRIAEIFGDRHEWQ